MDRMGEEAVIKRNLAATSDQSEFVTRLDSFLSKLIWKTVVDALKLRLAIANERGHDFGQRAICIFTLKSACTSISAIILMIELHDKRKLNAVNI